MNKKFLLFITFISIVTCYYSIADETVERHKVQKETKEAKELKEPKELLKEASVETIHSVKIDSKKITYKATAGNLFIKDEQGNIKGSMFYVSYTKEGMDNIAKRPVAFCFNGGPGSSAIWLHIGAFGPKKIVLPQDNTFIVPPYSLVDNEYSILDMTDLVFIDPISTGYSRAAPGEEAKQFHGVDEDVKSIANFIRLYATRFNRWNSPKFIAGESYGTTRAAALANYLHEEHFMDINGIILISSVLNFQAYDYDEGNDLPYLLFLPSFTATAWYYHKLSADLQADLSKALRESEQFALNEYSVALMQGDGLSDQGRSRIIALLSRYTGLSPDYIDKSNLRVNMTRFAKELLRDQRRTVGRFDSRYKGIDSDASGECFQYDPSFNSFLGPFTAAFNFYLRNNLKVEKESEYKVLANVTPWNYGKATNQYLNVTESLREVMTKNPRLKVFVANGIYDLATPYFATIYTFNHLGLDPTLRSHVKMGFYKAGHTIYIDETSLIQLKEDLNQFMQDVLKNSPLSN